MADEWQGIMDVVEKRQKKETLIISMVENLAQGRRPRASELFDKIYGALLASSIGNAMGSPVTARHFGKTWQERLNRNHFYVHCMGNAYDLICSGWDPRITGHWSVVTGSAMMCMEPVGLYHLGDPEWAYLDGLSVSYMYQRGLDVIAAGLVAAATAAALKHDASVESICKTVLDTAPNTRLVTFDERPFESVRHYLDVCLETADKYRDVLEAREALYDKCLFYNAIDPLEVLGLSLAIFKIANGSVRKAAIGGTNVGRDSDTIAGRAAMLSGAFTGTASVPKEWIRLFSPGSINRIRSNAENMTKLISQKKRAALNVRKSMWETDDEA